MAAGKIFLIGNPPMLRPLLLNRRSLGSQSANLSSPSQGPQLRCYGPDGVTASGRSDGNHADLPSARIRFDAVAATATSPLPPVITFASGWRKGLYIALGWLFVAAGIVGVLLPLVPTTPFLLLASFFFLRSSPVLHERLLSNRWTGPFLLDWEHQRGVRWPVKILAIFVVSTVVLSLAWSGRLSIVASIALAILATIGLTVIARVKTLPATGGSASPGH